MKYLKISQIKANGILNYNIDTFLFKFKLKIEINNYNLIIINLIIIEKSKFNFFLLKKIINVKNNT